MIRHPPSSPLFPYPPLSRSLAELTAGFAAVPADVLVSDVTLDSRTARPGALFLACRGRTHHGDRKSTRLNSSHSQISYAVFCLKKKKKNIIETEMHRIATLV